MTVAWVAPPNHGSRAQVSGELVQSVVPNKDTGRDVQHAVFSIEVLNGGAAAGRVTFAKDFLKVAVQKLTLP